jgi:hypothetical protein
MKIKPSFRSCIRFCASAFLCSLCVGFGAQLAPAAAPASSTHTASPKGTSTAEPTKSRTTGVSNNGESSGAATTSGAPAPDCASKPSTIATSPQVAVSFDPTTDWQPPQGNVSFTIKSSDPEGLKVATVRVCWNGREYESGPISTVSSDPKNTVTYNAVVPDEMKDAPGAPMSLRIMRIAQMRILVSRDDKNKVPPIVDVVHTIYITNKLWGLVASLGFSAAAFAFFWLLGKHRGVPGYGFPLRIISTKDGYASLSQLQLILWTLVIGAGSAYAVALSGNLINLTSGTLILLGISGAAALGAQTKDAQEKTDTSAKDKVLAPGKVTNIRHGIPTETEIPLLWDPATSGGDPDFYLVQYCETPVITTAISAGKTPPWLPVGEQITVPQHTVLNLNPGTEYKFQVSAQYVSGRGSEASESEPISTEGRNPQLAPPAPNLWQNGPPTSSAVTLTWSLPTGSSNSTSYIVQYRPSRLDGVVGAIELEGLSFCDRQNRQSPPGNRI